MSVQSAEVIVIAGPTASGKTDLALDVAELLGGPEAVEIINADSMQVYRGMDIGTAKQPLGQRRGIVHHLLDMWPIGHAVTVADYQARARDCVDAIRSRSRIPMLVGGSGLYIKAVIDDLDFPGTDPEVRARLEAELREQGTFALHRRLVRLDPAAAERILSTNGRRIVRALEVIEITGAPFEAQLPADEKTNTEHYRAVQIGLDRADLADRIALRVCRMWEQGFVEEVRALEADGLSATRTASKALGYQQVLRLLSGELTEAEAIEQTISATRRFARKQRAWFRRDSRIHWCDAAEQALPERVLSTINQWPSNQ
ncbi:tRNA dimethylallyltransferase [Antricoccus suffuscus]|uniref:tRNA dimethylallyltransferase n=1 Tax=Antricoccus suffuscus TaxID=1629062 RepID=A0A2T1A4V7_9ACTN|nr:tRNA (adenosine(37)-N6)-dimethylallyltransferase MiaA [Antricoccus suffuscus]PRZ43629.1 tRNA dimethylallyltransferase [Antricoccus suffuscus]